MNVKTRFAPSPTGVLHVGSVRTALFCWLYAQKCGGKFVLRIEDTDRERSTDENVKAILDGMSWLGLHEDEGPHYQMQRLNRYQEVHDDWLQSGKAYRCYCTREELDALRETQIAAGEKTRYNGRCRDRNDTPEGAESVIRFKNPKTGKIVVNDLVRGRVEFDNEELDDLVIARSNGVPTYNFTVVVDDADMQISHVIRGDDHLNNTPRQLNMLAAMNVDAPQYAHLPMILGEDGAKLSKRHGAVDVREYREQGYLPQALLNYLVRLGWSHGDQEIFSPDEMINLFDIVDVNVSASTFNPEKLRWVNQQHIIAMPSKALGAALIPYLEKMGVDIESGPAPEHVANAFRERAETLTEMAESSRYCFQDFDEIDAKAAKKHLRPVIGDALKEIRDRFERLSNWTASELALVINEYAGEIGMNMGKLGQPIRVAITGGSVSPPIDVTLEIVGRERTLKRLDRALAFIAERAAQSGG